MYQRLVKPALFRLEPEHAHALTLSAIHWVGRLPPLAGLVRFWFQTTDAPVEAFGLTFRNPVGLAAGYDNDGLGWRGLASLGFGHIEVGTVTLWSQPGNPQPRVFRLVEERGLINRMGFPGQGAQSVAMIQTGLVAVVLPISLSLFVSDLRGSTIGFLNSARFTGNALRPVIATSILAVSNLPTLFLVISGISFVSLLCFKIVFKEG